jgi:hypothetical protein
MLVDSALVCDLPKKIAMDVLNQLALLRVSWEIIVRAFFCFALVNSLVFVIQYLDRVPRHK